MLNCIIFITHPPPIFASFDTLANIFYYSTKSTILKCLKISKTRCVSWRDLELKTSIKMTVTLTDQMSNGTTVCNLISHPRSGVKLSHTSTYGVRIPFNYKKILHWGAQYIREKLSTADIPAFPELLEDLLISFFYF